MKYPMFTPNILATLLIASASLNAATPDTKIATEAKLVTAFTGLGILGLAAAGPVGLFVGGVGGMYVGEQIKKADSLEASELARAKAASHLQAVQTELTARDRQLADLQEISLANLQLQILFLTGSDALTPQSRQQVLALAAFLVQNPQLHIHLAGHSDPRGTDEYNDVLSHQRALTIQHALEQVGIPSERISLSAYGSAHSRATRGNLDSYALDRRVEIEILKPQDKVLALGR